MTQSVWIPGGSVSSGPQPPLRRVLSHPATQVTTLICTVVGVPLAIYAIWFAGAKPEIVSYVNPARAVVVQQGKTSQLVVQLQGKVISTDVTAAQVAIWNRGRQPVRRQDLLSDITIETDPKTPIIEASVRRVTRDVTKIQLATTARDDGKLTVSWEILEQNDGVNIQVVYAGGPSVQLKVYGTVVGQAKVTELVEPEARRPAPSWPTTAFLVLSVLLTGFLIVRSDKVPEPWRFVGYATNAGLQMLILYNLFLAGPAPPFGFD